VIDVDIRPPHKTLYEVLVVPPTTPSRQILRIARALRRNLPNLSDLDDVCLAEQVLGRRDLRAEYDALLARVRTAKLTLPEIGPAIEGSRPVAPAPPPPPPSEPFANIGRASAGSSGDATKLLVRVAIAAVAIIGAAVGAGSKHKTSDYYRPPEYRTIDIPRIEPPKFDILRPRLDPHQLGLDKLDADKLGLGSSAKPGPETLDLNRAETPRHAPPKPTRPRPRLPDPVPPATP
jgi:hypothetical protein